MFKILLKNNKKHLTPHMLADISINLEGQVVPASKAANFLIEFRISPLNSTAYKIHTLASHCSK